MRLDEKREAEINEEVRQIALALLASGEVCVEKGELDYEKLVKAYFNFSKWVAKAQALVIDEIQEKDLKRR